MAKKKGSKWLNPPFDPRILNIGAPNSHAAKLKRGWITLFDGGPSGYQGKGVQFLYNPVSVSVSHSVMPGNVINANKQQSGNEGQVGIIPDMGTLSIDLLYDRTYELWDKSKAHTEAGTFGVYADVLAYYRMFGIVRDGHYTIGGGRAPDAGKTVVSYFDQFPTDPISSDARYYLYVGDKMRWFGTIQDFSITYAHWTQSMVPTRCSVSLTLSFQTDKTFGAGVTKGVKHYSSSSLMSGNIGHLLDGWGIP